jgi:hypothetical protein
MIFKNLVTGPWDHKVSVSAKKVKKKLHACVPLIFDICVENLKLEFESLIKMQILSIKNQNFKKPSRNPCKKHKHHIRLTYWDIYTFCDVNVLQL